MFSRMLSYWLGRRDAVEAVASSRSLTWWGLVFVLLAGITREYDQEYILGQPLAFLAPLIVSLILSASLYLVFFLLVFRKGVSLPEEKRGGYRVFLNLFWMTAPMAWIYALPVERFLDPVAALQVNVALLTLVSVTRLVVLARALAVLTGRSILLFLLTLFAIGNVLVVVGTFFLSISLVGIMGGAVNSPAQRLLAEISNAVGGVAFVLLLPLGVGFLIVALRKPKAPARALPPCRKQEPLPWIRLGVVAVSGLVLLGLGQRQMIRNVTVEGYLDQEDYRAVVDYLSARTPDQFSAARPLPPRHLSVYFDGGLTSLLAEMDGTEAAWVRHLYLERLDWLAEEEMSWHFGNNPLQWIAALEGFSEGRQWLEEHRVPLQEALDQLTPQIRASEPYTTFIEAATRQGFTWSVVESEIHLPEDAEAGRP